MPSLTTIQRDLQRVPKSNGLRILRRQQDIVFDRLNGFKAFLERAAALELFAAEIAELQSSALFKTSANDLVVPHDQGAEAIAGTAEYIGAAVDALRRLLPRLAPDEHGERVFIRFPDAENVGTVTADLQAIEKAVLQVITHPNIGGEFKVVWWESGSLWIHVLVGSAGAVTVIAAAAWSAAVIAKKWMEFKIFREHARGLAIKNESLSDLEQAQEKLLEDLLLAESRNLAEKYLSDDGNGEVVNRVRFSIKTMSELIQRGGEVAPALNAPEDVRNLFPDYKALATISSSIKQLPGSSSGSEPAE